MILKGNQRAGGGQLAAHLLNHKDNDHIDVHDLRGFISDDLTGALKEAYTRRVPHSQGIVAAKRMMCSLG